jgi:hypothetical protein
MPIAPYTIKSILERNKFMAKQYYMLEAWGADKRVMSLPFNSLKQAKQKMQHYQTISIFKNLDFYIIPYTVKSI